MHSHYLAVQSRTYFIQAAEARWWGKTAGRVGFEVAATFVPVAGVAGKLSKGAKAAELGVDAARGTEVLTDAGRVAGKLNDVPVPKPVLKFPSEILQQSARTGIKPEKIQELLDLKKAGKVLPEPSTYISKEQIAKHLAKFDEGIVRITSRESYVKRGTLGPPGGFTMPASEFARVMKTAKGDLRIVEKMLGLDPGKLSNADTYIALIERRSAPDLRIPSGNEGGAHMDYWRPGGYTSGGVAEAVMDFSKSTAHKEIRIGQ